MENSSIFFTSLVTSSVTASIVSFLIKKWFEIRLKHYFDIKLEQVRKTYEAELTNLKFTYDSKLEKLKANLDARSELHHEIMERRLSQYPTLVEHIYRARNTLRDFISDDDNKLSLAQIFKDETHELENIIYLLRMDLERDAVFKPIHIYKADILKSSWLIFDLIYLHNSNQVDQIEKVIEKLKDLFKSIDQQHIEIVTILTNLTKLESQTQYE